MWILLNEIIIFGILLSLIMGYFGGFGLGINKEAVFKSKAEKDISIIKEIVKENNIKHDILSGDIKYEIERVIGYNLGTKAVQYKIKLMKKGGGKLTKDEINKILKKIYSKKNGVTIKNNNINNNVENNNTGDDTNNSIVKNNLLIYYGWPSVINGAGGDIEKAKNEFKKYKIVILGWGIQKINHPDYDNAKKIVEDLRGITKFYGYIPMVNGGSMNIGKLAEVILERKNLGVDGIFIDEAGTDYWNEYMGGDLTEYKMFLNFTYTYVKSLGMLIMYNSWIPEDLFNNLPLTEDDIVMIEAYYYANGQKKVEYENHVKKYEEELGKVGVKPKVACIATATNDNQELVNQIRNDIGEKMKKDCDYIAIQDDYGTDSNASVVVPNN